MHWAMTKHLIVISKVVLGAKIGNNGSLEVFSTGLRSDYEQRRTTTA
jgi:hypothetical protein